MKKRFMIAILCIACSFSYANQSMVKEKNKKQTTSRKSSKIANQQIDVLLLLALPASGKSEVRKFLTSLTMEECKSQFGVGDTVQIDDFPYVHMMRRISDECTKRGQEGIFFISPALPFREARSWGMLIHLINEDYEDMIAQKSIVVSSASEWLFERFDAARKKAGMLPVFSSMDLDFRKELALAVEADAQKLLQDKNTEIAKGCENKTIVIEFARGGPAGSTMPLPAPFGYRYALSELSKSILDKASVLYIWVTPEISRKKNEARADPNDPGSILHHCVPLAVMYGDYGCDDIFWLKEHARKPHTIHVQVGETHYDLPFGMFDNRKDKTTFVREEQEFWTEKNIADLEKGLTKAFKAINK